MHTLGERTQRWVSGRGILAASSVAAGLAAVLILFGQVYVFLVFPVASRSMAPTLLPEVFVLVNRLAYHMRSPRRGDLIAFRYPQATEQIFLKRIIAVSGDTIEARNGQLWVNGSPLEGPGMPVPAEAVAAPAGFPRRLPRGELFVLGDNPATSLDSRAWGTVKLHDVLGKAQLICWSHGPQWWDIRWHRIGQWLP